MTQAHKPRQPVSVTQTVDGWITPGISFDDYRRMTVQEHKPSGERRLPTPVWALNNRLLRELLVTFMEERCGFRRKQKGSLLVRLEHAKQAILLQRPRLIAVLDKLCAEYVKIKQQGLRPDITDKEWNEARFQPYMDFAEGEARYVDEKSRRRALEIEIEGIDTYLRYTANGGADIIAAIVWLYYRVGMDSVNVAAELGLKPPHVRMMLWRLHGTWKAKLESKHTPSQNTGNSGVVRKDHRKREPDTGKPSAGAGLTTPSFFEAQP